ncbi:hypothetical protein [Nocardia arizonensis]|uniref:hypothetical protein n=1 Tax=Nocardia arizonensis TaxID=1141647 RepID=UPI0012E226A2|nr:hypothetical protein [Nocardia arizonensis]
MKDRTLDNYTFRTDDQGREFFSVIASHMTSNFEISEPEAVARINHRFIGMEFFDNDLFFHKSEEYWARDVLFGHDVWWKSDADIAPLPAPGLFDRWLHKRRWWLLYWRWRRQRQIDSAIWKARKA